MGNYSDNDWKTDSEDSSGDGSDSEDGTGGLLRSSGDSDGGSNGGSGGGRGGGSSSGNRPAAVVEAAKRSYVENRRWVGN